MQAAPVEFFEWFESRDSGWRQRPWLVLGKGPTFALLGGSETGHFNTFGLNHTVLETRVDIAHAIDIDVIQRCADVLQEHAGHLLMPWIPYVNNRPGRRSLLQWMTEIPVLAELAAQGRLLWYNKAGSSLHGNSPPVRVLYFSAEAPYALLGMAGVKTIRSLGIDGGDAYAACFDKATLHANGRSSFDLQFDQIARSIMTYRLDAAPLNLESPVRIYVAATEEQMLSVKVLEYSILKHASMTTIVVPLHDTGIEIPCPKDERNRARTPFSFQRFLIPEIADYKGRAIYLDSDMQVLTDIRELWQQEMGDNQLLSVAQDAGSDRKPQYSVMLLDCDRLHWKIENIVGSLDTNEFSYEDLMEKLVVAPKQAASIGPEWNSLEKYAVGRTKLVHYTDMNTQPWIFAGHPIGHIWARDLIEAVDRGFIDLEYVVEHVKSGWVRPSLTYQVEHRIEDPLLLPKHIQALDRGYSPPYYKLRHLRGAFLSDRWRYLKAIGRSAYYSPLARRLFRRVRGMLQR